jgi:7-cyano-7-deazaguanine synthase in queuosine biosynthesis
MVRALFRCDEAPAPDSWLRAEWDIRHHIRHLGRVPDLNLRIQNLSHALLTRVDDRAADLTRIAAYVYAADQMVSRGGPKDVYSKDWRRVMAMAIPVSDSDFWNDENVRTRLQAVLSFLSDDVWDFTFTKALGAVGQLPLDLPDEPAKGTPDSVILFSGGADSLCAAVEAAFLKEGKPVLVSHRSAPNVSSRQKGLIQELRRRHPGWYFPHISVWVHRKGSEARDRSQRTRAFLFASLGATVANQLGLRDVLLGDNGVASLNLPINAQLVGALATRSTHPRFIALFNDFVCRVLPGRPLISNPLRFRTRAEALQLLPQALVSDLLQATVSCSYSRGRPLSQIHCGVCSQCIDRRFGSLGAGLAEHDLAELYGVEIFSQALAEGDPRTLALSYVRFAREILKTPADGLFDKYPQLYECLLPDDPSPQSTAEALIALLQRHARTVVGVLEAQVVTLRKEIAAGDLSSTSLVGLAVSPAESPNGEFRAAPGFRSVWWRGEQFTFGSKQAQAVELLFEAHQRGTPDIGQDHILVEVESKAGRLRDLFKNHPAWNRLIIRGEGKGIFRLNI